MAETYHAMLIEKGASHKFSAVSISSLHTLLFSDCICPWLDAGRLLLKREYCRSVSLGHQVFIPEGQVINKCDKYTGRHHLLAKPWASKLDSDAALHKRGILIDAEEHTGERRHISAVCGSGHFALETQKGPQFQDFRILFFLKQKICCWHRAFHVKKASFPELTFPEWEKKKILQKILQLPEVFLDGVR